MDIIDRKIIAHLQEEGRISLTDLADRVALSLSPCHRRVRELEATGVIQGYHARVDPGSLGFGFEALAFVTLNQEDRSTVTRFEEALIAIPNIVQAERLFGDPDYLLRIVTEDIGAYQRLYDERLGALPGVQRISSTLVMKTVVNDRALPFGDEAVLPA